MQSLKGQKILNNYGLQADDFDSFILINDGKSYLKSTAGLKVLKLLGTPWNVFYIFILIPAPIRDFVYTLVAKTRYKIFGKRENCIIPQPEYADRFME